MGNFESRTPISPGIYDDITFGLWIVDGRMDKWMEYVEWKARMCPLVILWLIWHSSLGIARIEIQALMATAMDGG